MDKLQEDEGEVLSRRDALSRERERVAADRQALEQKKKQGGDTDAEEKALLAREAKLQAEETDLQKKLEALLSRYRVEAQSPAGADTTRREAQVATREKDMSRREGTLAEREARLADREKELAKRERETCVATPATIVQTVPYERGSKYSRRDVEPLLASARRKMSEKGLLASDLPAPAKGLEREATHAMGIGDYGRARFAADQLVATIESVKVDKSFISAKISRLNGAIKGAKLGGDAQKQVDDLFREATSDYGDGKFTPANGKLNRIFGMLQ